MKKLSFVLFAVLLAQTATAVWVYDGEAKTLTQGSVVLQNVSVNNGTELKIGNNQTNATAIDVDLSTGVEGGYIITTIDASAFSANTYITSIKFPDTLITLGNNSFRDCTSLTCEIELPASLTGSLGWTFRKSPITGDIVVPDGITYMKETFLQSKITSLVVGRGVQTIDGGDGVCCDATALTNVVFLSGCKMGQNEFIRCTSLQSVTFHPGMSGHGFKPLRAAQALQVILFFLMVLPILKRPFIKHKSHPLQQVLV